MHITITKLIVTTILLLCSACQNFRNKSKTNAISVTAISDYKMYIDTTPSALITTICFTKTKRNFVVQLPYIRDTNLSLSISKGRKINGGIEFIITSADVPLAQYRFLISELVVQPLTVKYTFEGRSPRVCYKVVHNDTLDLRENNFFDSCFQVERLEKPFDNFNIVYAEPKNNANIIKIVNTKVGFEDEILVKFPNKILSYIPEAIFGIIYVAKNNKDTNIAYFSVRNDSKCYIDSVCDIHFKKTEILNTLLRKNYPNRLNN